MNKKLKRILKISSKAQRKMIKFHSRYKRLRTIELEMSPGLYNESIKETAPGVFEVEISYDFNITAPITVTNKTK